MIGLKARQEWARVVPALIASGTVTVADRATVMAYCIKFGEWMDASKKTTTRDAALKLMLRLAIELGMTPAARTKVHATPPTGRESTWADVLP